MNSKFMPLILLALLIPVLLVSGCTGLGGPEGTAVSFTKKILRGNHDSALEMMVNAQGNEFGPFENIGAQSKMGLMEGAVTFLKINPNDILVKSDPEQTQDIGENKKRVRIAIGLRVKQEKSGDILDDISNKIRSKFEANFKYQPTYDMMKTDKGWKIFRINL